MKRSSAWWIRVPIFFFLIFGLMEYFTDSGNKPAFIAYPITQLFLLLILLILIAIELIAGSIESVMFRTLSEEARERYLAKEEKSSFQGWARRTYLKLLGTKPVTEEHEIIMDHNYDGIRELDNKLPPWWVYMFYITFIFGLIYMVRFHILDGYTQDEEYEQEVLAAQQAIDEYKKTARDLVDINTVQLLTAEADIKAGETIYVTNCAVCHKADGGGGIGPNLTDEYWILGGGIKNVFNTISEGGRPGKGMISWKSNLKPIEMAQVGSYILSLQGTTPAEPKESEGEIWIDPNTPSGAEGNQAVTDRASTEVVDNSGNESQ